jgi:polyisoprenoid-binding protein YceI
MINFLRLATAALAVALSPLHAVDERFVIVPGRSTASYSVDEVFLRENNRLFTAVGVTPSVSGEIVLDRAQPARSRMGEIRVDLRQLASDSDRRDRALREKYLDTRQFPFTTLTNATLTGMPAKLVERQRFSFALVGDMTLHGTTRRTSWQGDAILVGDTLRGSARTQVRMSEFGIEVPRLLSLRSEDDVIVKIHFVAAAQSR